MADSARRTVVVFVEAEGTSSQAILVPVNTDCLVQDLITEVSRKIERHPSLRNRGLLVEQLQVKENNAWLDPEELVQVYTNAFNISGSSIGSNPVMSENGL
eukprot:TRINITY_DN1866_c0_g1_i3.p1 TRINITY_DN1866_c0_g1~~TRINITY_DN1866_c0_g1_i3.p1  ORF type:complete len:101 (+),score=12.65 TRINITY_DN1866_c0_g1_i3:257-559(+)